MVENPQSFGRLREEIRANENLKVLLNHTVVGFAGTKGTITAIQAVDRAGQRQLIAGDCFILAAGTIEISRLLLHAAATPGWGCPWRDNSNVGAYFQDHLAGRIASLEMLDRRRFFDIFCTIVWSSQFSPNYGLRMKPC